MRRNEPRPFALIPVYNHAATVSDVVRGASRHLQVLVVDDGSTDGSGERAAEAGAEVLRLSRNQGKGAALLTGMRAGSQRGFSHALVLDADGQHDSGDIPVLLSAMEAFPKALVVGDRAMKQGGAPFSSRIGRWISNFWVTVEGFQFIWDAQCGFRVYPIRQILDLDLKTRGFDMEIEVLVEASRAGMDIISVPVSVEYDAGRVSHFDLLRDNLKLSALNARLTMEVPFVLSSRLLSRLTNKVRGEDTGTSILEQAGMEIGAAMARLIGKDAAKRLTLSFAVPYYFLTRDQVRQSLLDFAYRVRPTTTATTRTRLAYRTLYEFASSLMDRYMAGPDDPGVEWDRKASVPGIEKIRKVVSAGSGAVLVTAHVGRWAQAALVLGKQGLDPVVVMDSRERDGFTVAAKRRGVPMPRIIPAEQGPASALEALNVLKAGRLVAFMGDRPAPSGNAIVRFLGGRAQMPIGPYLLASRAGVPWFAVGPFLRRSSGLAVLVEGPFQASPARGRARRAKREAAAADAQRFASILDRWCRLYPEQWFNFDFTFLDSTAQEGIESYGERQDGTVRRSTGTASP